MPITVIKNGKGLGEVTRYDRMVSPDGKMICATYWTTSPLKTGEEYEFHFEDGRISRVRIVIPGPPEGSVISAGSWGWRGSADVLEERPVDPG